MKTIEVTVTTPDDDARRFQVVELCAQALNGNGYNVTAYSVDGKKLFHRRHVAKAGDVHIRIKKGTPE